MLSLRAVNQFYGSQHTLWNVNLDFPQGMCTGVVGLPGMGKTTLMNCIAGRVPVESGSITATAKKTAANLFILTLISL